MVISATDIMKKIKGLKLNHCDNPECLLDVKVESGGRILSDTKYAMQGNKCGKTERKLDLFDLFDNLFDLGPRMTEDQKIEIKELFEEVMERFGSLEEYKKTLEKSESKKFEKKLEQFEKDFNK